ncbi:hypothetical protein PVK06_039020 [Gossypium arboreum]|uniref:Uncharacterized protein n=1 Tax=Gossypium arboreum TaxID=29729 RepID=A0ABR0N1S3_GOSAR|nr:hypothetical protein PVK06_039020 [Gossypium arboreum]
MRRAKQWNKCPTCTTLIGHRESSGIYQSPVPKHKLRVPRSMKLRHENPCSCPVAECNFEGLSKQLCRHFRNEHGVSATTT